MNRKKIPFKPKYKQSGIFLLLSVLLIFGAVIGFLHGQNGKQNNLDETTLKIKHDNNKEVAETQNEIEEESNSEKKQEETIEKLKKNNVELNKIYNKVNGTEIKKEDEEESETMQEEKTAKNEQEQQEAALLKKALEESKEKLEKIFEKAGQKIYKPEDLAALSNETLLDYLHPLIISSSIDNIIQVMEILPVEKAKMVVEHIASLEGELSRQDKIELLLGMVVHLKDKKETVYKIFEIFSKNKALVEGYVDTRPFVYIAAISGYNEVLSLLFDWLTEKYFEGNAAETKKVILKSGKYAIDNNDIEAIMSLAMAKEHLTNEIANELLFYLAQQGGHPKFVPILKDLQADLNYSPDERVTVLIKAVESGNIQLVEALLELGATVDLLKDVEVGTALQKALEKDLVEIELLLREYGAREKMDYEDEEITIKDK